jgi:hypothetical protein
MFGPAFRVTAIAVAVAFHGHGARAAPLAPDRVEALPNNAAGANQLSDDAPYCKVNDSCCLRGGFTGRTGGCV